MMILRRVIMKSITQAKTNLSVTTKRAIDQLTGDWGDEYFHLSKDGYSSSA